MPHGKTILRNYLSRIHQIEFQTFDEADSPPWYLLGTDATVLISPFSLTLCNLQ